MQVFFSLSLNLIFLLYSFCKEVKTKWQCRLLTLFLPFISFSFYSIFVNIWEKNFLFPSLSWNPYREYGYEIILKEIKNFVSNLAFFQIFFKNVLKNFENFIEFSTKCSVWPCIKNIKTSLTPFKTFLNFLISLESLFDISLSFHNPTHSFFKIKSP